MTDIKALMRAVGVDQIIGADFETYWANDYTLSDKKVGTTDYIVDPRFKAHMVSVQNHRTKKAKVLPAKQIKSWARTINWARTAMLCHHANFDGLIFSHHYGIKPKFYFDTMSMSRPVLPIHVGVSLDRTCRALGLQGKVGGDVLVNTKGIRDLSREQYKQMASYAGNDIEQTWGLFYKLLPFFPIDELKLIDLTVKMYCQPKLLLDANALQNVLDNDVKRKADLLAALKVDKTSLTSKPKFAALLRAEGVEPPSKVSVKQSAKASEDEGREIVVEVDAMSKQDLEFVQLLSHPKKRVRQLVEARFAVSSNLMESRCRRLISRAPIGPQPVYLNYAGAKTLRWSGSDLCNWQNLSSKRKEGGEELRASVHAPPGHQLLIADLAQIEARINFWFAGQTDKVEIFRNYDIITGYDDKGEPIRKGPDVYRVTAATDIYRKPIAQVSDGERFVGKSAVLGLGFQCGAVRYAGMLRVGALGPPVEIEDEDAARIVRSWRASNPFVVANWKKTQKLMLHAFLGQTRIEDGVVAYEGTKSGNKLTGWMHLPGGMAIRYDDVQGDDEGMSYTSKFRYNKVKEPTVERTRLYGGISVENRTQALARNVVAKHALNIVDKVPAARLVLMTHDELVFCVPNRSADKLHATAEKVMSTPPSWAPDLPLGVEAHLSTRYDK